MMLPPTVPWAGNGHLTKIPTGTRFDGRPLPYAFTHTGTVRLGALPESCGGWFVWRGTVCPWVAEICDGVLGGRIKTDALNAGGFEYGHCMAIISAPRFSHLLLPRHAIGIAQLVELSPMMARSAALSRESPASLYYPGMAGDGHNPVNKCAERIDYWGTGGTAQKQVRRRV